MGGELEMEEGFDIEGNLILQQDPYVGEAVDYTTNTFFTMINFYLWRMMVFLDKEINFIKRRVQRGTRTVTQNRD